MYCIILSFINVFIIHMFNASRRLQALKCNDVLLKNLQDSSRLFKKSMLLEILKFIWYPKQ